ncbi:MAG: class I SAM-dependent methyltransferase, partial [Gaiellaceae bacterium]
MSDVWAEWLRTRRTGGDPEYERRMLEQLATVRDKVLDNAALASSQTVLDVGCGNGLIAFGALERGASVVFADISRALLDDCRQLAADAGIADRCRFVEAAATELDELEDESIDVVTTRSVLIYVKNKVRAFAEFHRVLRPGGRISLFEPINRFGMAERRETWGYDVDGVRDLMEKLTEVYARRQPPEDPMLDFDERDLISLAEDAGFFPIHLEYHADIEPTEARNWDSFVHSSGNPKIPTLAE